jgi:aldose 1-epimerase
MSAYQVTDTVVAGFAAQTLTSVPGSLTATFVPDAGMVCCSLNHAGDELLDVRGGVARYAEHGSTMGIPLLHPWANRLAGFRYTAAGRRVVLDPDSPLLHRDTNGLPMHGVQPHFLRWRVDCAAAAADGARIVARLAFDAPELLAVFPFPHELEVEAVLRSGTLTVTTTLRPTSDCAVPVSFGYHPYLRLPGAARADWCARFPVRRRVVLDERQIPTGASIPVSISPGPLADRSFDAGFDELDRPARFTLAGGGRRISVELVQGYTFAQVFAPAGERFICFEPMTAATNALIAGTAPIITPGTSRSAVFTITVEPGETPA